MDKIYDQREELHKIKAKTERVSRKSECACSVEISELSLLVNLWESKSKEEGLSDFDRGVARGLEIAAMGVKRKIKPNDPDEA